MKTLYTDMDIDFSMDNIPIHALNIVFERFTRTIPSHCHGNGCYEIHYIPFGCGKLTANGQYYDISPNTLYVTGPHVEHAQTPILSDPMQEYCVYLKIRSTPQKQKNSPVINAFTSVPFWIGGDTQGIHALMKQLFNELEHRYTGFQNQVRLLLSQLLIYIVRDYERCRVSQASVSHDNMSESKSIMIEEYFLYEYRSLSLDTLSNRLNLSTRQTQRLLMEYYGKSFQQKKKESRMSVAAILLSDKTRSITSIAEDLGYSSVEHFASAFRNFYRTSPRNYRKQLISGTQTHCSHKPLETAFQTEILP